MLDVALLQGIPSEKVTISNVGVATKGPVIVEDGQLMLEYTNGSACRVDGKMSSYTTRIHFVCSKGPVVSFTSTPSRLERVVHVY